MFLGAKKRLRLLKLDKEEKIKKKKHDPNVVGLEESSDESSSGTDNDDDDDDDPEIVNGHDSKEESTVNGPENNETTEIIEVKDETTKTDEILPENSKKTNKKTKNASKNDEKGPEVKVEKKPLLDHPTVNVQVKRDPKIQVARLKLPILGEEQRIMELINENEFLIVAGETGNKIYKVSLLILLCQTIFIIFYALNALRNKFSMKIL